MNPDLKTFLLSMLYTVLPALFLVATMAFVTMPYILGHHPGEALGVPALAGGGF